MKIQQRKSEKHRENLTHVEWKIDPKERGQLSCWPQYFTDKK